MFNQVELTFLIENNPILKQAECSFQILNFKYKQIQIQIHTMSRVENLDH